MNWINYLLQTNFYLLCFYALYKLAFSRETYFNLNRAYLVGFTLISFFIPFWQSGVIQSWFITKQISQTIYSSGLSEVIIYTSPVTKAQPFFNLYDWLIIFYSLGVLYMSVLFCINLFKAQQFVNSKNAKGLASSFFGKISIDKKLAHQDVIFSHEHAHGKQVHSFDLMLISVVKIICWFNPIVYLLHIEFKKIHEFIADNEAATHLGSKKTYAEILVSNQFSTNANALVHNFYDKATVKTRLIMLSRRKSPKKAMMKYGMIAPAFIGMLILASSFVSKPEKISFESADLKNWNFLSNPFNMEKIKGNTFQNGETSTLLNSNIAEGSAEKFKNQPFQSMAPPPEPITFSEINPSPIFTAVEEAPEFPGGVKKMYEYIGNRLIYPTEAIQNNTEGRVFVKFVVNHTGEISNLEILKGIGNGCEDEAKRVLKNMPKWKPGKQNGKPVNVYFTMPIVFKLESKTISNAELEHANILKGKAAIAKYGEQAQNGAMVIELNDKENQNVMLASKATSDLLNSTNTLFAVNGKLYSKADFDKLNLDPNNIKSLSVFKNTSKKYPLAEGKSVVEIAL
ncbi:TonB family C-terminal domain-containing protein [Spirosomataceae bacterium TFI 002]|nr:TonB family C-terminal domain-containing protein [Spirosomataceae bacterium TFI 002]